MITIAQFGAGRIGAIHAANIAATDGVKLKYIVDVNPDAAKALASKYGARVSDTKTVFADKTVDAVVIASSTDTHASLAIEAAEAGKAIFCEKPIDLSLKRVDACLKAVAKAKVPMFVGFNRRFDPSFRALHDRLSAGEIGKVEQVIISSRDPGLPPLSYLKVSGGQFRDMTIHDFDMARWLLGEEPVEVFALGSVLVDRAVAKTGDIELDDDRHAHRLGQALPHQQQPAGQLRLRPAHRSARLRGPPDGRQPHADHGGSRQWQGRQRRQAALLLPGALCRRL